MSGDDRKVGWEFMQQRGVLIAGCCYEKGHLECVAIWMHSRARNALSVLAVTRHDTLAEQAYRLFNHIFTFSNHSFTTD